jgi:DNA polymerase sigma
MIGLYLKHLVKINKIGGAADNYISSYALLVMLIFFLQKIIEPHVLPNLQKIEDREIIYEYIQNGEPVRVNIYFEEDVQKIKQYMRRVNNGQENTESPSDLLLKFFEYFSYYYDYYEQKLSIHDDTHVKKKTDNIAFSIEDPFDKNHNPGKSMMINSAQFNKFITTFKKEINYIMNGEYVKRLDKIIPTS